MTEVQKGIEELEKVDLTREDATGTIENIIESRFKKLPSFQLELDKKSILVRCRFLNENEEFHNFVKDHSYNPCENLIKIGRANYDKQPIFYAARNRGIAMAEARILYNNRDSNYFRCSISAWEVVSPLQLAVLIDPLSIPESSDPQLKPIAQFISQAHEGFENKPDVGEFLPLWAYISKKFTEVVHPHENFKYKVTAALSNFIYRKLKTCDGIFYQSVKDKNQFNIALKKEAVDEGKISLNKVIRQKFIKGDKNEWIEDEMYEAKQIDYLNGKIIWR